MDPLEPKPVGKKVSALDDAIEIFVYLGRQPCLRFFDQLPKGVSAKPSKTLLDRSASKAGTGGGKDLDKPLKDALRKVVSEAEVRVDVAGQIAFHIGFVVQ